MSEFWYDPNFWLGLFVAVIVGVSGLIALMRWRAYSKPPSLDAYFVLNPVFGNESTAKTIAVPASDIIVYFAIGVNDDRSYEKPYVAVKFPPAITIFHDIDHTKYYYGKQPRLSKPNEALILFNEYTLRKGQVESFVFPLIIRTQVNLGEYPVIMEIGAPNVNAKATSVELKLRVVKDGYSHEQKYFDLSTFDIRRK